jgi:PPOX class probable F420-dependent enzyme
VRLSPDDSRARFTAARVARLATVGEDGAPHLVPVVFAVDGDTVWTAVDAKPKRTTNLQRLRDIAADPRVSLLVDHYAEDWTTLWWARADGEAAIAGDDAGHGLELLIARYPQYRAQPPPGPVLAITVRRWSGWAAA